MHHWTLTRQHGILFCVALLAGCISSGSTHNREPSTSSVGVIAAVVREKSPTREIFVVDSSSLQAVVRMTPREIEGTRRQIAGRAVVGSPTRECAAAQNRCIAMRVLSYEVLGSTASLRAAWGSVDRCGASYEATFLVRTDTVIGVRDEDFGDCGKKPPVEIR